MGPLWKSFARASGSFSAVESNRGFRPHHKLIVQRIDVVTLAEEKIFRNLRQQRVPHVKPPVQGRLGVQFRLRADLVRQKRQGPLDANRQMFGQRNERQCTDNAPGQDDRHQFRPVQTFEEKLDHEKSAQKS